MKKENIIEIQEQVNIDQDNETIILEKGDKIKVLEREDLGSIGKGSSVIVYDNVTGDKYRGKVTYFDRTNNEVFFKYNKDGETIEGNENIRHIRREGPVLWITR